MLYLIRVLRGVVVFELTNGYIERFINLAAKDRVPIWGTKKIGNKFVGKTTLKASHKLENIAKRAAVTVTIKSRYGLPILYHKHQKRYGIFIGATLSALLLLISTQFIVKVEVMGNEIIPTHVILQKLKEQGVGLGSFKYSIDPQDVERQVMISDPHFSWVALNIKGSTATLLVRETTDAIIPRDVTTPHNIVANNTGFIVEIQAYEGQRLVQVGDSVVDGQLLVSGILQDGSEKTRLVYARARVIAQVADYHEVKIPYIQENYNYQGYTQKFYLNLGKTQLPLWGSEPNCDFKVESQTTDFPVLGNFFDLGVTQKKYLLRETVQTTITEEQALQLATQQLLQIEETFVIADGIITRELSGQDMGDYFLLTATYQRLVDIAREVELL